MRKQQKPKYKEVSLCTVQVGQRLYSQLIGEAYPVDEVTRLPGGRIDCRCGCLHTVGQPDRKVWIETKPRTF